MKAASQERFRPKSQACITPATSTRDRRSNCNHLHTSSFPFKDSNLLDLGVREWANPTTPAAWEYREANCQQNERPVKEVFGEKKIPHVRVSKVLVCASTSNWCGVPAVAGLHL